MAYFKSLLLTVVGLFFASFSVAALPQCAWGSSGAGCAFQVQAVIENGCAVSGGGGMPILGDLNFGSYPSLSTATATTSLVASSVFHLNCTPNMTLTFSIDGGLYYDSARRLQKSGTTSTLVYQLYSDATMQTPIGVGQGVTLAVGLNNTNIVLPVYGRLILPGNKEPGIYTDTLTVEVSW